jgi:Zn-dependent peptidase ImmA (M78 family)
MSRARPTDAAVVVRLQSGERLTRGGKPLPATFLLEQVDLAWRYAKVEKLVLGETQVRYSPMSLGLNLDLKGDVVAQGEQLATAERARHNLTPGPILEIEALIEDQGLKVIARRFPPEATSLGAFFFDGKIGPTILVNAAAAPADVSYAVARHYGHFLADYEPYPYIICGRPDPQSFTDPSEVRAHTFALAFLMPAKDLEVYREAMALQRDQVLQLDFLQQLQVYFEVDAELLLWRFLSLGWINAEQLQVFLATHPDVARSLHLAPERQPGKDVLPDRFVQLVARAFGENLLRIGEAATLLGVDEAEAARLLGQFRYDTATASASPTPRRRDRTTRSRPSASDGESIH